MVRRGQGDGERREGCGESKQVSSESVQKVIK